MSDASFALAGGGAEDDAIVGVDGFKDLAGVLSDVGGIGAEDELGVAFDSAVAEESDARRVWAAAVEVRGDRRL